MNEHTPEPWVLRMTRAEQLAQAYELVAKCDHYMIGIVENVTDDELNAAEHILITRENSAALAIELIENEKQARLDRASRG